MQIDMGATTHKQLVIMYANGNDAEDGDGNGEIDDNSLLWEATAKNSISIGASENYRPSRGVVPIMRMAWRTFPVEDQPKMAE